MKFKHLNTFLYIAAMLLTIELALEYRAKENGFNAFILNSFESKKSNLFVKNTSKNSNFPFRSPLLNINTKLNKVSVWMSSASYAEDKKRKIEELFPNILCEKIKTAGQPCQMLNAAKAGYTIKDNIRQLKQEATKWNPNYVLLYSMNLDINNLSIRYLGNNTEEIKKEKLDQSQKNNLSLREEVEGLIEKTTVYTHLRRYIGGEILLSAVLHNNIGNQAKASFKATLNKFIDSSRNIGATPILVTFATKYNINNYRSMPHDDKLFLVRYNEYLSDLGWVRAVHSFNEIIRQTAEENNVSFIDLAKTLSGKKEYFSDFVHFTKKGHSVAGSELANDFIEILKSSTRVKP